jgi:hypothetical protein
MIQSYPIYSYDNEIENTNLTESNRNGFDEFGLDENVYSKRTITGDLDRRLDYRQSLNTPQMDLNVPSKTFSYDFDGYQQTIDETFNPPFSSTNHKFPLLTNTNRDNCAGNISNLNSQNSSKLASVNNDPADYKIQPSDQSRFQQTNMNNDFTRFSQPYKDMSSNNYHHRPTTGIENDNAVVRNRTALTQSNQNSFQQNMHVSHNGINGIEQSKTLPNNPFEHLPTPHIESFNEFQPNQSLNQQTITNENVNSGTASETNPYNQNNFRQAKVSSEIINPNTFMENSTFHSENYANDATVDSDTLSDKYIETSNFTNVKIADSQPIQDITLEDSTMAAQFQSKIRDSDKKILKTIEDSLSPKKQKSFNSKVIENFENYKLRYMVKYALMVINEMPTVPDSLRAELPALEKDILTKDDIYALYSFGKMIVNLDLKIRKTSTIIKGVKILITIAIRTAGAFAFSKSGSNINDSKVSIFNKFIESYEKSLCKSDSNGNIIKLNSILYYIQQMNENDGKIIQTHPSLIFLQDQLEALMFAITESYLEYQSMNAHTGSVIKSALFNGKSEFYNLNIPSDNGCSSKVETTNDKKVITHPEVNLYLPILKTTDSQNENDVSLTKTIPGTTAITNDLNGFVVDDGKTNANNLPEDNISYNNNLTKGIQAFELTIPSIHKSIPSKQILNSYDTHQILNEDSDSSIDSTTSIQFTKKHTGINKNLDVSYDKKKSNRKRKSQTRPKPAENKKTKYKSDGCIDSVHNFNSDLIF